MDTGAIALWEGIVEGCEHDLEAARDRLLLERGQGSAGTLMTGGREGGKVHHLDREGDTLCGAAPALDRCVKGARPVVFGGVVDCLKCRALAPLKPCPFCGTAPSVLLKDGVESTHSIFCQDCGISGPDRNGPNPNEPGHSDDWLYTRMEIVEAWNRRAP